MSERLQPLLIEARRVLGVSQGDFGELLGSSRRSGQRWETTGARPSTPQLHVLARHLHAHRPDLAAAIAAEGDTTLEALGLAPPPPAPGPPAPPPAPEDIVDAVVCAAADAIDVTPRAIRPAVIAAFRRARKIGLSVDAVVEALGGKEPGPRDRGERR